MLGDPGARDAAIHGIQACIPHATLLPVGVERLWTRVPGDRRAAHHRRPRAAAAGGPFVYDVEILARDGALRERWDGLTLKAVGADRAAGGLGRGAARGRTPSGGWAT